MADDTKPSANADAGNMDDFFEEMFGQRPKKRGKGYELLVAAAIKLSGFGSNVSADRFIKGEFSKTTYQLDAHVDDGAGAFVEAKDYTEKRDFAGAPVGRGDAQKLAGALQDLNVGKGILASATGFTRPTKKYAASSVANPKAKPIELLDVRRSVSSDERGRIRKIVLHLSFFIADYDNAEWTPKFTAAGMKELQSMFAPGTPVALDVRQFVKEDGSELASVHDLTGKMGVNWDTREAAGEWRFQERAFIEVSGRLVEVDTVSYRVPHVVESREIVIEATGKPVLLIRSLSGNVDKLLTDADLKRVRFDEDGGVEEER
jgi:hypothetical protein